MTKSSVFGDIFIKNDGIGYVMFGVIYREFMGEKMPMSFVGEFYYCGKEQGGCIGENITESVGAYSIRECFGDGSYIDCTEEETHELRNLIIAEIKRMREENKNDID